MGGLIHRKDAKDAEKDVGWIDRIIEGKEMKDMEHDKDCMCHLCLPGAAVPPPNPPPAGDKEEPTPAPSQEGNKSRDYKNESQQNLIKIVEYLARDVFKPTTTQEIMEALALTKSKAHCTLHNLKIGGWAEQVSGGWRLSPELVKIADSVRATLKEAMHRYL